MTPRALWEGRLPLFITFLLACAVLGSSFMFQLHPAALTGVVPFVFILWFFRDPPRRPPAATDVLLAPADGIVSVVTLSPTEDSEIGEAWPEQATSRISIFLSVFDVHVNRSPVAGRILSAEHRPGGYLDARDPRSGSVNEAMTWRIQADAFDGAGVGPTLVVRQIAGKIARRIVAWKAPGDRLEAGERFGMIRFGSRTDLFLPAGFIPIVNVGERVRAGSSIVAARAASPPSQPLG